MRKTVLDLMILRTFVEGVELGSFTKAAEQLALSPSAVSAQLRKLEEQIGAPLFVKVGRKLALTATGETMFTYARRLLSLNDEAVTNVRGSELAGSLRLGLQEDFGEVLLPQILSEFSRSNPGVFLEARVARNAELIESVRSGKLDLAVIWSDGPTTVKRQRLAKLPIVWIGKNAVGHVSGENGEAVHLVSYDAPCHFRSVAIEALEAEHMPWRQAFTSASLAGLFAAVRANLGITPRPAIGLPADLKVLGRETSGLPALPRISLSLIWSSSGQSACAKELKEIVSAKITTAASAMGSV